MKTTIELPEPLMSQAKAAARAQGLTLKALIEAGLRMAIHPMNPTTKQAAWSDLTFHPQADEAGHLIEPSRWREAANPASWSEQK